MTSSPSPKVLGLAIGIPSLVLVVLSIIALTCYCCIKTRKRKRKVIGYFTGSYNQGAGKSDNDPPAVVTVRMSTLPDAQTPIPVDQIEDMFTMLDYDGAKGFHDHFKLLMKINRRSLAPDASRPVAFRTLSREKDDLLWIDGIDISNLYAVCLSPPSQKPGEFWRAVKANSIQRIVYINQSTTVEADNVLRWPKEGETLVAGMAELVCTEVETYPGYAVYNLGAMFRPEADSTTTSGWKSFKVSVLSFPKWSADTFPDDQQVLSFVRRSLTYFDKTVVLTNNAPGIAACYITICEQIKRILKTKDMNVLQYLAMLRKNDQDCIKSMDQYRFIYEVLLDFCRTEFNRFPYKRLTAKIEELQSVLHPSGATGFEIEYQQLFKALSNSKVSFDEARRPVNSFKNRPNSVLPYDFNLVKIAEETASSTGYINASYMDSFLVPAYFIVTQAPITNTVDDFWTMVWKNNVLSVVMLTDLTEADQEMAVPYFPSQEGEVFASKEISIELLMCSKNKSFEQRNLKVSNMNTVENRLIQHYWLSEWDSNSIPLTLHCLGDLVKQVICWQDVSKGRRVVVHCSGGGSRSGLFVSLYNVFQQLEVEWLVDVFQTVRKVRSQRESQIDNKDQYEYLYRALQQMSANLKEPRGSWVINY